MEREGVLEDDLKSVSTFSAPLFLHDPGIDFRFSNLFAKNKCYSDLLSCNNKDNKST